VQQFQELSTDVFDELIRRNGNFNQNEAVPFLPIREDLHPKRNQARQKLAALTTSRLKDLSSDVHYDLSRRFPELEDKHLSALDFLMLSFEGEDDDKLTQPSVVVQPYLPSDRRLVPTNMPLLGNEPRTGSSWDGDISPPATVGRLGSPSGSRRIEEDEFTLVSFGSKTRKRPDWVHRRISDPSNQAGILSGRPRIVRGVIEERGANQEEIKRKRDSLLILLEKRSNESEEKVKRLEAELQVLQERTENMSEMLKTLRRELDEAKMKDQRGVKRESADKEKRNIGGKRRSLKVGILRKSWLRLVGSLSNLKTSITTRNFDSKNPS